MRGFTKHKVLEIFHISDHTFVIRFERKGLKFIPGQFIVVGLEGDFNTREYSIFSGIDDDYLEILVRLVNDGYLTNKLQKLKKNDVLIVYGPFGEFVIDKKIMNKQHLFIASGTGISPFRSFVKSYPNINYTIIHGVRYMNEAYYNKEYDESRYILCTSKDNKGAFNGRVTDYLKDFDVNKVHFFYVSGNNMMITDVISMLKKKGVKVQQIKLEIYF